ncbi:uncharacterized protein LY79DRAFT_670215 [Colletotrichum navitas]|uniref:Uncharacterized protein n=1 Tax=Colletotrichum navitas TaxID=681940 RepID=A0AAD8V2P7_9PEZI|nr:uncharacterized protein LY79DRAFT_670215 [Colletotrichum navitas]KAK1590055.1 hypothetical protein LY79DRAFT_670215 [Colletotrichum navitas]
MLGLYHNSDIWRPPERPSVPQKQKQKQKHKRKTQDYELLGPTSQDCKRKREVGLRLAKIKSIANTT